jgi:hypothetical protein
MQVTMRVPSPAHVAFGSEDVVHAPNHERHVALLFQRDKHAAVVAMLLQLDSFDFHGPGQAVALK